MTTIATTFLPVAGIGMDQQSRQLLSMVFKGPAKGRYQLVEKPEQAQLAIFDWDHWQAEKLWQDFRKNYPALPTVVLSLTPRELEHSVFVNKPLSVNNLLDALSKIQSTDVAATVAAPVKTQKNNRLAFDLAIEAQEEAFHEFCGHAPNIDPSNQTEIHRLFYQPDKYLQGCLQTELADVRHKLHVHGVVFENLSEPFLLLPKSNRVFYGKGFNDTKLHMMASLPMQCNRSRIQHLTEKAVADYQAQHQLVEMPLDHLLWKMSLWTARGRIPQETDLNRPIVLLHWPNFTRLVVTPYALQIAALWVEKPLSLLETVRVLNIPQRYVFSFYSAASALGIAFPERREGLRAEESANKPLPQHHAKRGLLKRLLAHITG